MVRHGLGRRAASPPSVAGRKGEDLWRGRAAARCLRRWRVQVHCVSVKAVLGIAGEQRKRDVWLRIAAATVDERPNMKSSASEKYGAL